MLQNILACQEAAAASSNKISSPEVYDSSPIGKKHALRNYLFAKYLYTIMIFSNSECLNPRTTGFVVNDNNE